MKIAIIGAGISGLASAYYLNKFKPDAELTIFDAEEKAGGKICTISEDGFILEKGPDSFVTNKPACYQLCEDLGITDKLQSINKRPVYILKDGKLLPYPTGFLLGGTVPLSEIMMSPVFSLKGKMRFAKEPFIPAKADDSDESLADFLLRRLGPEAVDYIGDPLLASIYGANVHSLSVNSSFANFAEMEREHGSLLKGLQALKQKMKASGAAAKKTPFYTFRDGMQVLVDTLTSEIRAEFRLNTAVESVESRSVKTADETFEFDHVILALPAYISSQLLRDSAPDLAELFSGIEFLSTAAYVIGIPKSSFPEFDGTGFIISSRENSRIQACTVLSNKFDNRCPDDHVLIRIFLGGHHLQEQLKLSDEEHKRIALEELSKVWPIAKDDIVFDSFYRWENAFPQYNVGHKERVSAIEASLSTHNGLHIVGSSYHGVGLPDCIAGAKKLAEGI
ncbi:MAG: protoporphyrinogen oxidase [Lentisphaeria bacterium]|nr:protoporphyrinogen oxidase [Lentisphaeria bacterium]